MYLLDTHDNPLQASEYKLVPSEQKNVVYKVENYHNKAKKRKSVQRIMDLHKKHEKNSNEMVKGLLMINKYFGGEGNDSLMSELSDLMSKGFKFNSS